MLIVNVLASPNLSTKSGAKLHNYLRITIFQHTKYTVNTVNFLMRALFILPLQHGFRHNLSETADKRYEPDAEIYLFCS